MQTYLTAARMQSPSSINTFKQCPRRYYYTYIKKYPTMPSIHLVRGSIAHSVLEDLFDEELDLEEWHIVFHRKVLELLDKRWDEASDELSELDLEKGQLDFYYKETKQMLLNWANDFQKRFQEELVQTKDLEETFENLTPVRERE